MSFSLTEPQYQGVLRRLTALEERVNDLCVAIQRFVTLDQVSEIQVVQETRVQALEESHESLEARVTAIEEEPLS